MEISSQKRQQELSKKLAQLTSEKRTILIKVLQKKGIDPSKLPIIATSRETNQFTLSWGQERLWFLDQLEENSSSYNLTASVQITGNLQIDALQKALTEIVRRHEVLRTNFLTINGQPIQVIKPESHWELTIENWHSLQVKEAQIKKYIQREQETQFDLTEGSLVRAKLLKLSPNNSILIVTRHHIVWDGWSTGIFLQELSVLYQAYSTGKSSPLPDLSIQYVDYAIWQKQWLNEELIETQLNYWKQQLVNATTLLQLPTDKPRPSVMTKRGEILRFTINQELNQKLQQLSMESGTTLFMLLLSAYATLLYRYSHQEDILIGSPIANRNREEIEPLIGFFINTLVLRTRFSQNLTFLQLLAQVKEITLAAYNHQDVCFEKILETLKPSRTMSYSPLFQVMFILQNTASKPLQLFNLQLTPLTLTKENVNFDLILEIEKIESGLIGIWKYNTDLFTARTIEQMAGNFYILLEEIVANPNQIVDNLRILTAAERQKLLIKWNDTQVEYPQSKSIYQLFAEQVKKTPDAVAILFEYQRFTYQELNKKANDIAHHLQNLGVGTEVLVGICLERSIEMIVAILGIFKAGGAYLPLDPNYPQDRLLYMLSDSRIKVVLTKKCWADLLSNSDVNRINLDVVLEGFNEELDVESHKNIFLPKNLAYVIYTSGSTGKPKAVAIPHKQILNRLFWMWETFPFQIGEIACQKTSINFVDSIWEIFGALLQGIPTVIIPNPIVKDPYKLVEYLGNYHITRLWFVPSLLETILNNVPNLNQKLPNLKFWVTGGEAISMNLFQRFQKSFPQGVLHNSYGASEFWDATWYTPVSQHNSLTHIPIGKPIANIQTYILDSYLQPVPIGVAGELHIGGDGLARGYLNRPELTVDRFINSPFSPHKTIYKTGDLARYLPDGNIEYLGRIDNQIKIRGFRIELGEIEVIINDYINVKKGVVTSQKDTLGNQNIVAYLLVKDGFELQELRNFLKSQLPDYMIPSAFIILESFPLTPNGKIDRKVLPEPEFTRENLQQSYQAPRTASEVILCEIFSQLLNINPVGVQDNFFDLGGHSLLAVRLMALIQDRFKINLPLAILLQSPTVEELALLVDDNNFNVYNPTLIPIQNKGNQPPLFFVPGAGGNVIYLNSLAQFIGTERPFYGLQPNGLDGQGKLDESVEEMAFTYIQSMKQVQSEGPYFIAGHSFGGWIAYEIGRQLLQKGEKVGLILEVDTLAPKPKKYHLPKKMDEWQWLEMTLNQVEGLYGKEIGVKGEELQQLNSEDEQYAYALDKLIKAGILPQGSLVRQLRGIIKVYKANNEIEYVVKEDEGDKLPIVLFRSQGGFTEEVSAVKEEWFAREDWGWQEYASIPLAVEWIPGDHHTMMAVPHVEILAQKFRQYLD